MCDGAGRWTALTLPHDAADPMPAARLARFTIETAFAPARDRVLQPGVDLTTSYCRFVPIVELEERSDRLPAILGNSLPVGEFRLELSHSDVHATFSTPLW